jgi:HK97 family phage major capsid protein
VASTVRSYLEGQKNEKLAEAASISEEAEKTARGLTELEKAQANRLLEAVDELDGKIKAIDDTEAMRARIEKQRGPATTPIEEGIAGATSIGEAFVKSEGYRAVKEAGFVGKWTSGAVEFPGTGAKATVTEAAGAIVPPDVVPGILPILAWPTRVADLFSQGTTTSTTVRVVKETTATNAAAGVAEGAAKPESTLIFTTADETVGKIATFLPVSDEMLEDVQQMQSYLDGRLILFVKQAEDSDLLNGTGAPTVDGVLHRGGIQTGSALSLDVDSSIDAIFRAATAVRVTGLLEPDGIVMHPTDWAGVRLMKDVSKQYYGGGPFTGAYGNGGGIAPDNLWGLPVVVTTAIAQGTALIGAFKTGAQIFRKRGLTVEASNSHSDFFQKNLTAIRAEERLALAVFRPAAFFKLTGVDQLLGS